MKRNMQTIYVKDENKEIYKWLKEEAFFQNKSLSDMIAYLASKYKEHKQKKRREIRENQKNVVSENIR